MKIGIDVSLAVGEKAGVGYYINNLVRHLAMIDDQNEYLLYPVFCYIQDPKFKDIKIVDKHNFAMAWTDIPAWKIIGQWKDKLVDKKSLLGDVDILHSNTYCAPKDHPGKLVVTIHDVSFLLYPEFHTEANRIHCLHGTIDSALYADKIIAVSQYTKNDLIEYFGISEEKIVVIHEAADEQFKPVHDSNKIASLRKRYSLEKEYILTVGSLEPRKNHKKLIQAYAALPDKTRATYNLVIAGGKGWLNSDIPKTVEELGVGQNVQFLGYVPEADLPALYSAATIFAYPSLYEGFGLPVLEAMSCGCATLAGDNSSLKEITAKAALLVDAQNVDDICGNIQKLLLDDTLRVRLQELGKKRASEFSWKQTAIKTLEVYKGLV